MNNKMKNKRKIYIVFMMMMFIVLFSACGNKDNNVLNNNSSFYDKGQEMILTMHELVCDEGYIEAMGAMDDLRGIIDTIGGMDYSSPAHVYRVSNMDDLIGADSETISKDVMFSMYNIKLEEIKK